MKQTCFGTLAALLLAGSVHGRDPGADMATVVRGNNQFALELYGKLRDGRGNLFLSPYSISTALGMTYAGARTQTAEEMARVLHFTLDNDTLHPALGALIKQINGEPGQKRGYQLTTANALWGQKGFPFQSAFLKLTKDSYGAGLNEVDFAGDTEQTRQTINAWVEKQTENKIKDLLVKGILTADTRLVLTNAIYFKGDWVSQFKKDQTREESFLADGERKVKVPFMHQAAAFRCYRADTFQMLELPYVGKDLSMVVLLPKKLDGLADLEKTLTLDKLNTWLSHLRGIDVELTLPKFKLTAAFELEKVLPGMGMRLAFTEGADFSGLYASGEKRYIKNVIHKAFVEVSEEGTTAAAATAVSEGGESAPETAVFKADHPFLFLIRDKRSGSILFLGRLVDPTK
jgi:serine protease inhibitor